MFSNIVVKNYYIIISHKSSINMPLYYIVCRIIYIAYLFNKSNNTMKIFLKYFAIIIFFYKKFFLKQLANHRKELVKISYKYNNK